MNTKFNAVTDVLGRPIKLFMTVGWVSDYIEARALAYSLSAANGRLGGSGYDTTWFRGARKKRPAFQNGSHLTNSSNMTSFDTASATGSRSFSGD